MVPIRVSPPIGYLWVENFPAFSRIDSFFVAGAALHVIVGSMELAMIWEISRWVQQFETWAEIWGNLAAFFDSYEQKWAEIRFSWDGGTFFVQVWKFFDTSSWVVVGGHVDGGFHLHSSSVLAQDSYLEVSRSTVCHGSNATAGASDALTQIEMPDSCPGTYCFPPGITKIQQFLWVRLNLLTWSKWLEMMKLASYSVP